MHYVQLAEQNIPVGKIVAIGRNYAAHARELGNPVPADEPVLFMKPASSLLPDGGTVTIPGYSSDCHHEIELALLVGTSGKNIPQQEALQYVAGYGVALDLTLRDIQNRQKAEGLPWEIAKAFDTSCPVSRFVPSAEVVDSQNLRLELRVNGELRQQGTTADMLRPIPTLLAEVSRYFTLEAGDILLTGTPAGVGAIRSGDLLEASISGVGTLRVTVA